MATYRSLLGSQILPTFADRPIEAITPAMIDSWIAGVDRTAATRVKLLWPWSTASSSELDAEPHLTRSALLSFVSSGA